MTYYSFNNLFYNSHQMSHVTINLPGNMAKNASLMGFLLGKYALTVVNIVNPEDLKYINDMGGMFSNCNHLEEIKNISNGDVSNVKYMTNMFVNCQSLVNDNFLYNIANGNTSNLQYISNMFYNCQNFNNIEILSSGDMSNIKEADGTFYIGAANTNNMINREWDLSNGSFNKIEVFSNLFYGAKLISLKMGHCNGQNLRAVNCMFGGTLQNLEIKDWYTPFRFGDWNNLFWSTRNSLRTFKANNWIGGGNITSNICLSYCNIFTNSYNLHNVEITNGSYKSNINGIFVPLGNFFGNCQNLNQVKLSNWQGNINHSHYAGYFFRNCYNLTSENLILENGTNFNNLNLTYFFQGCRNLTTINLDGLSTGCTYSNLTYMFSGCSNLRNLYLNNLSFIYGKYAYNGMFSGIPSDCNIGVKDQNAKNYILNNIRSDLTNIQIAS